MQYVQDNDEQFFPTVTERTAPSTVPDTAQDRFSWSIRGKTDPYIKSQQIFRCPSNPNDWPEPQPSSWWYTDYGFNHNEGALSPTAANPAWIAFYSDSNTTDGGQDFGVSDQYGLADIESPANFLLLADSERADGNASRGGVYPQKYIGAIRPSVAPPADVTKQQARIAGRHIKNGSPVYPKGGANIAYADGHAKFVSTPDKTWRSYNDNDWRRHPKP